MAMGNKSGRLVREAAKVQSAGRDGDTVLAHINPREARMLRQAGGRGTRNPQTGLLEFANAGNFDAAFYLAQNPDVAAAGVDPWQHYQQHGQNEGRVATQQELAARAEGYTGLFGRPESGQNYVDWKNSQSASGGVTVDLGPNNALNDYLRSQLPDVEPNFDGQGGFWTAAERAGYPRHFIENLISGFTQNFDQRTGAQLRPEASGFYNGSALQPHSTYDASGAATGTYGSTGILSTSGNSGGLLGGGGFGGGNSGGAGGGGYGGGSPVGRAPGAGGIYGSGDWTYGGFTPANPTIGSFANDMPQQNAAPQTFEDILAKYSLYSAPLQNGTGFNWMTPQTTPGQVNIMDGNLSRRYL
jgi:hypothetical protein